MIKHLKKRFAELAEQIAKVESTKQRKQSEYTGQYDHIDDEMFLGWCVKARNLLSNACGIESQHFILFSSVAPAKIESN